MNRCRGYSLIELLVVLAVLAVLSGMAMPLAQMTQQREKERELKRALWELRDALDAWRMAREAGAIGPDSNQPSSLYPPDLQSLTQPIADARPDRKGQVLRFLRTVPRDPFADSSLPSWQTWALRSYRSEADAPQPGEDVYDIHSRSGLVGLNGVPLRQW